MGAMQPLPGGPPFIEVRRGPLVESVHCVAAYAVDAAGSELLSMGTVDVPIYLRSAAKPFIAATALMAGVQQRFGLEQYEIAVMAASHSGEPFHVDAVRSILRKIGLDESALQCGADYPYDDAERERLQAHGIKRERIFHNCSGKHAGILSLCRAIGADPSTYMERQNPAQQRILAFCAQTSGARFDDGNLAVDGCGIPVYATTLRNAAQSYLRLATLTGMTTEAAQALRTVREAMIAYPEYMSGTGDFDAELIRAYDGALVCKGGAEGVHATALIEREAALVVKIVDGNERARPPAAIEALRSIGMMNDEQYELLQRFARPLVKNRAGRVVGEIGPVQSGSRVKRILPCIAALVALLIAGCSHSTPAPSDTSMTIAQQWEPRSLNPALENGTSSAEWSMLVFSYLVKFDDNGNMVPDLATEVPTLHNGGISADGKTITYHIHKGVRFADGTPLTANDVAWSIQAINNPTNNVQSRFAYSHIATRRHAERNDGRAAPAPSVSAGARGGRRAARLSGFAEARVGSACPISITHRSTMRPLDRDRIA